MRKVWIRVVAAALGSAVALLVGELLYRALHRDVATELMYFRDGARKPWHPKTDPEQRMVEFLAGVGHFQALPPEAPQPRPPCTAWNANARFFICYDGPRQPYFDQDGCVEYRFNQFGIRDRDDLTLAKPAGTTRVVCLGDSFTLGWGVRQDHNWPVLVEGELHRRWPQIQVVNCGGAGSSYADEYWYALDQRFGAFQPDLVLVTLCLNDLLITNGKLTHCRPEALVDRERPPEAWHWWMASKLCADLIRTATAARAFALDPGRDWVQELLDLPGDHPYYAHKGETPAIYWAAGTPQKALRSIRDWSKAHGARAAVVVWPLLQGLDVGAFYPFAKMHRLVVEFCAQSELPCLDLLPTLQGKPEQTLWVSPADQHPNEIAQQLVAPALAAFVADCLRLQ